MADDLLQQRIEAGLGPVEFDHQHRGRFRRHAQGKGRLDGVEDPAVHEFQRGRNDPRGDDLADGLRGVVDRSKRGADRAAGLRIPRQPGPNLGHDRQRALAAADQSGEVQHGRIFHGSELHDRAVAQHDLQPGHVVDGHAIFQRVRTAGVGGHVAADGRRALARRVGSEVVAGPRQRIA